MKQFLIFTFCLFVIGCNGSGTTPSPVDSHNDFRESSGSGYTLVVGYPYVQGSQTGAQYYSDLLNRLSPLQFAIPASRILLSVQNPTINNIFNIGASISTSGLAVQFLAQLAESNPTGKIEVYAYPDVEKTSGWENWAPPQDLPPIASCSAINNTADVSQQDVLKSICWVGLVNQLIRKEHAGLVGVDGVAYDGQSFIMGDTDSGRAWIYSQTSANNLKLGWLSQGLKSSVDLNLLEVYDLGKYNHNLIRVDGIAPETVSAFFSKVSIPPVCTGSYCSYTGIFPGTQWTTSNGTGAVGANIYQCAISAESNLSANGCNSFYTSAINTESGPASQILQSMNYINNFVPDQELTQPMFFSDAASFPSPMPADAAVVYLFSTQYIGPIQSYAGSNLQCTESAVCSCVASAYNPLASCGEENGFGTWGNKLTEFKKMSYEYLLSQQINGQCPFPGGCRTGMYMYDFIPQQWYSQ